MPKKALYLVGSMARGEAEEGRSDIDLVYFDEEVRVPRYLFGLGVGLYIHPWPRSGLLLEWGTWSESALATLFFLKDGHLLLDGERVALKKVQPEDVKPSEALDFLRIRRAGVKFAEKEGNPRRACKNAVKATWALCVLRGKAPKFSFKGMRKVAGQVLPAKLASFVRQCCDHLLGLCPPPERVYERALKVVEEVEGEAFKRYLAEEVKANEG